MNSIQQIVEQALCTGCGACAGLCPANAITLRETPGGFLTAQVEPAACTQCRQCLGMCPSNDENQRLDRLADMTHGHCMQGYIGHATTKSVRREGQSGGVVTALLLYLLENGKIDGAVTNQFNSATRRPKAVYVDTAEGVKASAGSYYCQTPVVKTILEHREKRLAAVVLGCQGEALRLLKGQDPGFQAPQYTLGLICAGQNSGHMLDELIASSGCGVEESVEAFRFRYTHPAYGGWPGNVLLVSDKYRYRQDKSLRHALKPLCEAYRCLLCYDQMCVDADVAFGDPWGIKGDHAAGETVAIARTEKGRELLAQAQAEGYISMRDLAVEEIMKGESVDGRHTRKVAAGYLACKENGWQYPYAVSSQGVREFGSLPKRVYKALMPRLRFARARCLAQQREQVVALTNEYKKKLVLTEQKTRGKALLLLPIRGLRYLFRKLKP